MACSLRRERGERREPSLVNRLRMAAGGFEGFRVWGLGFRVWGLGFGVWGLGFRVWGLGFRVSGLGFRGLGFRV